MNATLQKKKLQSELDKAILNVKEGCFSNWSCHNFILLLIILLFMSLQIYDYYLNGVGKMGENFEKQYIFKLLPLQGALLTASVPRALPWAKSFWAFSPFQPYS